jgi:hypothetical protein
MDSDQQKQFAAAVERKKAEAEAASRAPHEEHAGGSKVSEGQKTATDASHEGPRPAGQKGGGTANNWYV